MRPMRVRERWKGWRPGLFAAVVALAACGPSGGREGAEPDTESARRSSEDPIALQRLARGAGVRTVDLTHPLSQETLYWPTGSSFEHERLAWGRDAAGDWYSAAAFSSPEHLGTHLDAPIHFAESGWTSAEIPAERFLAPGAVIDISARSGTDPDAVLVPDDIAAWEIAHGPLPDRAIVIVRTGWGSRWPDWERYYGSATPKDVTTFHFPGVSAAAATALVDRAVAGVGIDTASIDAGPSTRFEAHRVLAAGNVFNLENLTRVDELPAAGFLVVALPMKIEGGTGGPARVLAVVPAAVER